MINNKIIKKSIYISILFCLLCVCKKDCVLLEAGMRKAKRSIDKMFDQLDEASKAKIMQRQTMEISKNVIPDISRKQHKVFREIDSLVNKPRYNKELKEGVDKYLLRIFRETQDEPYKKRVNIVLEKFSKQKTQALHSRETLADKEISLLRLLRKGYDVDSPEIQDMLRAVAQERIALKAFNLRAKRLEEFLEILKKNKRQL